MSFRIKVQNVQKFTYIKKTTLDRNASHQLLGFLENNFKITFRMFEVPSEFTDSDSDLVVTDASYNI